MELRKSQVLNCSFPSWYPLFKDHTIKSHILEVPDEFVKYLLADGLVLPTETHSFWNTDLSGSDLSDWEEDQDTPVAVAPHFPQLEASIRASIVALGGKVLPKMTWSSPKDATWITATKSMCCQTPTDVFLLLKSSQFVMHDLTNPLLLCSDYVGEQDNALYEHVLVLRRWHEISPLTEFRCFIKDNKVIAICQRHPNSYYACVREERKQIIDDILSFYSDVVAGIFPSTNYVMDVYRKNQGKVYLIDFNPFGGVTEPLLYTWEELKSNSPLSDAISTEQQQNVSFRCVETNVGIQPCPYGSYSLPQDFVDLSTGQDPDKFLDFLKLSETQEDSDGSDL